MDDTTRTILQAAANMLRGDGLDRARDARTIEERDCANHALLASVTIEQYLAAVENLDRPF